LEVEALFMHRTATESGTKTPAVQDDLVQRALTLMRSRLEKPFAINELCVALSCQPRPLDRRSQARLGASPGTVYRHIRLAAARKLIEGSQLGMAEISVRCGYESPSALTRAFGRQYGKSPRDLRRN